MFSPSSPSASHRHSHHHHRGCGMRRPSPGTQHHDEDGDLSRLASTTTTTTPNSATSTSSSDHSIGIPAAVVATGVTEDHEVVVDDNDGVALREGKQERDQGLEEDEFDSVVYAPQIIDLEWPEENHHLQLAQQQLHHQPLNLNRKRKERQDSTSSNSQTDRKVIRSNNNDANDQLAVDQEQSLFSNSDDSTTTTDRQASSDGTEKSSSSTLSPPTEEEEKNGSVDQQQLKRFNLVAASHQPVVVMMPLSHHDAGDDHYSDGEHERRRSSERFCRSRAPHGRKSSSCSSAKKSLSVSSSGSGGRNIFRAAAALSLRNHKEQHQQQHQIVGGGGGGEEGQVYKYDSSALKSERRGFNSRDSMKKTSKTKKPKEQQEENEGIVKSSSGDDESVQKMESGENYSSSVPPLPWNEFPEDSPVVCPRFSDGTFDHVINVSEKFVKIHPPTKKESPIKYVNNENMKTRDIMRKYATTGGGDGGGIWTRNKSGPGDMLLMIITPEERMRQINGRLAKLKKRILQYEETYERDSGRRPEKLEMISDKTIKTIMTEIQKLKREKQVIKNCDVVGGGVNGGLVTPLSAVSGGVAASMFGGGGGGGGLKEANHEPLSGDMKFNKMQETLTDIEMVLQERRKEEGRVEPLDRLTVEQLLQEKTAVQKGLLYLETLFGRPTSKEERDMARSLYDRYRQIKRMLNRNSSMISAPVDLPTILEHEAMIFTSTNNTPSTDTTPLGGNTDREILESSNNKRHGGGGESTTVDNPSTTTTATGLNDNLHQMSIAELWHQLDVVRDEKKALRRTIKEHEQQFEVETGRKMMKGERKSMEETYALYKQKKGRLRLLDALVKKHMAM